MSDEGTRSFDALADLLKALASPNRLELLSQLRSPRIQREIRLAPERPDAHSGLARPISRQAVQAHLEKLVDAGAVLAQPVQRATGETLAYVVNHQRLFAISEELRALANLRPYGVPILPPTTDDVRPEPPGAAYPRLLVVRGLREGTAFRVVPTADGREARWVIGRKHGCEIQLDYDPYLSAENTLVTCQDGRYSVTSLPMSRNGTTLNFNSLQVGEQVPLSHGDVIGAGRSLLLFQERPSQGSFDG